MSLAPSVNGSLNLPLGVAFDRSFFMGVTGLTLTLTIAKASGAFGAIAGAVTEKTDGWYKFAAAAADLDTEGSLALHATDGGVNIEDWCDQVAAPVKLADGVAHGGTPFSSTATLAFATLTGANPAGDVIALISGGGGSCINLRSPDGGDCLLATSVFGNVLHFVTSTGPTVYLNSNAEGIVISSVGNAISLTPQDGSGIAIVPSLSSNLAAAGISVLGAGTGPAVQFGDGSSGAEAFLLLAGTGAGADCDAVKGVGQGSGAGFESTPAAVGFGGGGGSSPWDDVRASHTTPGTFGEYVSADAVLFGGNAPVQTGGKLWVLDDGGNAVAPAATALTSATWTDPLAAALTTLASHDPGSTLMPASAAPPNFGALGITPSGQVSEVVLSDTLTTYTGNVPQTGDSFALIGSTGSGLTSLAPASTALSTATWTGALATALTTLAGHDPGGTLASQTNITGGTITTVTNLTNAPTSGDFTAAMKASLNSATPAVTVSDKTGFALTSAYDFAKGTVAMTESYAALGAAPTPAQVMFEVVSLLSNRSITGTTLTNYKLDGTTAAMTFVLNNSSHPTSQLRSS